MEHNDELPFAIDESDFDWEKDLRDLAAFEASLRAHIQTIDVPAVPVDVSERDLARHDYVRFGLVKAYNALPDIAFHAVPGNVIKMGFWSSYDRDVHWLEMTLPLDVDADVVVTPKYRANASGELIDIRELPDREQASHLMDNLVHIWRLKTRLQKELIHALSETDPKNRKKVVALARAGSHEEWFKFLDARSRK